MNPRDCLTNVREWMNFYGWTEGGGPGSVKKSANGNIIGRHGDGVWITDCDAAVEHISRERETAQAREALAVMVARDGLEKQPKAIPGERQ